MRYFKQFVLLEALCYYNKYYYSCCCFCCDLYNSKYQWIPDDAGTVSCDPADGLPGPFGLQMPGDSCGSYGM